MKSIRVSFLLAFALCASLAGFSVNVSSITPLKVQGGQIECTAFSINKAKHYWMTARHCVGDVKDPKTDYPYILETPTKLVAAFPVQDVVILEAPDADEQPALHLSKIKPVLDDHVLVYGYAAGFTTPTLFNGFVANESVEFPDQWNSKGPWTLYDMRALGGDSGSPVLDKDNNVIGVLQFTVGEGGPAGGVRWTDLKKTSKYWEDTK